MDQPFQIDLKTDGGLIKFNTSAELRAWLSKERSLWSWFGGDTPQLQSIMQVYAQFFSEIEQYCSQWDDRTRNGSSLNEIFERLRNAFERYYQGGQILYSESPVMGFIKELRGTRGNTVGAGAFAMFLKRPMDQGRFHPEFIQGLFEGFLYLREIDWTASNHQELLNRLREKYEKGIREQDSRAAEIESRNAQINNLFEEVLKERQEALKKCEEDGFASLSQLKEEQIRMFTEARDEHEKS